MIIKNINSLKNTIFLLMILAVITFLTGFLKYTPFEHITLLLFLGGVKLYYGANHVKINGYSKLLLILTSVTTIVFMALVVIAIAKTLISGLTLSDNLELLEGLFYLTSLIFIIGILGGTVLLNIKSSCNSTQY